MFERARRRLTWLYVGILAGVLLLFSGAFWFALSIVLQPNFDLAPELSGDEVANISFRTLLERAGLALIAADLVAIVVVAAAAWFLARRTLQPVQDATERQARFVADASHEIRSPIAAVRSTAEAALIGDRSADELRTALTSVVSSSERLSRIANDLLLLARTGQPEAPFDEMPFDLSVAVAEAVAEERAARMTLSDGVRAESDQAAPAVSLSLKPDLTVRGDPVEVNRIVLNLVDNGLRHGGGRVSVRTLALGNEAILEVADRGPGIAPEDLGRIFQPFFRARSDTSAAEGTGLGLAIAMSLARRNRGRITVDSRQGTGSTFRLVLPLAR
jgi:signal transduction histidine kinase